MHVHDRNMFPEAFKRAKTISKIAGGKPTRIDFFDDLACRKLVMQHITEYDEDLDMIDFKILTISNKDSFVS